MLEIGCAYGYFLKRAEKYYETYGIDISEFAINKAKKVTKNTKLFVGNVEKDFSRYFSNIKFDFIVALDVLEHLHNPQNLIQKIYNSLNNGGYFFFRVPNTECIDFKLYSLLNKKERWHGYTDKTHVSLFDLGAWKNIIKSTGFEYELIPVMPTKFLKSITMKKFPRLVFLPRMFIIFNKSALFRCKKQMGQYANTYG